MVYLAQWRRKLNITQSELADRSGLTQSEISKIENGLVSPSLKTIQKVAKPLRIQPANLFNNPLTELKLSRYEIDEFARNVISGRLPVDENKAALVRDIALLVSRKLIALNKPGKSLVRGSRWDTKSRYLKTQRSHSERSVKQILARVDKLL